MKPENLSSKNSPPYVQDYAIQFRERAFRLVHEGYTRLRQNGKNYTNLWEEEISHDLAGSIEAYTSLPEAPNWVERFSVYHEHPISPNNEVGRERPRLDIRIRSSKRPDCPVFVFEAKRLYGDTTPGKYFGDEGLRAFLIEGGYPVNAKNEAGMLGYIQTENETYWIQWLRERFRNRTDIFTIPNGNMDLQTVIKQLPHTYYSKHLPDVEYGEITIFHVLLPLNVND